MEQVYARICADLVPGLEGKGANVEILSQQAVKDDDRAVAVHYRVAGTGPHWLACQFDVETLANGAPRLRAAISDRWGERGCHGGAKPMTMCIMR